MYNNEQAHRTFEIEREQERTNIYEPDEVDMILEEFEVLSKKLVEAVNNKVDTLQANVNQLESQLHSITKQYETL